MILHNPIYFTFFHASYNFIDNLFNCQSIKNYLVLKIFVVLNLLKIRIINFVNVQFIRFQKAIEVKYFSWNIFYPNLNLIMNICFRSHKSWFKWAFNNHRVPSCTCSVPVAHHSLLKFIIKLIICFTINNVRIFKHTKINLILIIFYFVTLFNTVKS